MDLTRFMFNNFIEWIKACIEIRMAQSFNVYMDLEGLIVLEIDNL